MPIALNSQAGGLLGHAHASGYLPPHLGGGATRPGSGLLRMWLAAASPSGAAALRGWTFSSLLRRHCRHQCRPRVAVACPWVLIAAGTHGLAFIADDGSPTICSGSVPLCCRC